MKTMFALAGLAALLSPLPALAQSNRAPVVAGDFIVNVTMSCQAEISLGVLAFMESDALSYPGVIDMTLSADGAIVHQLFSAHFSGGRSGSVVFAGTENAGSAIMKNKNGDFPAEGAPITAVSLVAKSPYALAGSRFVGTVTWQLPFTDQAVTYSAYFNNIDSANNARTIVFQGQPAVKLPNSSDFTGNCSAQGTAQAVVGAPLR